MSAIMECYEATCDISCGWGRLKKNIDEALEDAAALRDFSKMNDVRMLQAFERELWALLNRYDNTIRTIEEGINEAKYPSIYEADFCGCEPRGMS